MDNQTFSKEIEIMETEKNLIVKNDTVPVVSTPTNQPVGTSYFRSVEAFAEGQRMCQLLAASSLVPKEYQGNVPNVMIALEIAHRTGSSPLAVMQSLYVIQGRPSWSSQFVIAALNSCGKFSPLRFHVSGEGDEQSCYAWALEKGTQERLDGPAVSIAMAKKEGWYSKKDRYGNETSKWQTMPELMLRYRAATFFGRLYAPDILMGMQPADEVEDIVANEAMQEQRKRQPRRAPQPQREPVQMQSPVPSAQRPAQSPPPQECPTGISQGDMDSLLASAPPERATQRQETKQDQQSTGDNPVAEYEAAVKRYKADIDSKMSLSELQWWPDRNRFAMERELDGKDSEWYLGVMEYHKKVLEKMKSKMK